MASTRAIGRWKTLTYHRLDISAHLKTSATFYVMTSTQKQSKLPPIPEILPNPDLTFDPVLHRYRLKGELVPWSVTGITSHNMSQLAREAIEKDKPNWEPRGRLLHQFVENLWTGRPLPDVGIYKPWSDALQAHPIFKTYEAVAVEHRMVSKDGFFAGSFDALVRGVSKAGDPLTILIDLKTLKHEHSPTRSCAKQFGAYTTLLNDAHHVYVDKCVGLFSRPGSVELVVEDPQDCIDKWQHCLTEFKKTLPDW